MPHLPPQKYLSNYLSVTVVTNSFVYCSTRVRAATAHEKHYCLAGRPLSLCCLATWHKEGGSHLPSVTQTVSFCMKMTSRSIVSWYWWLSNPKKQCATREGVRFSMEGSLTSNCVHCWPVSAMCHISTASGSKACGNIYLTTSWLAVWLQALVKPHIAWWMAWSGRSFRGQEGAAAGTRQAMPNVA